MANPGSIRPLTDAVIVAAEAASSCTGQDADTWQSRLNQLWQPAVKEVVDEYFEAARHSFRKGEHPGGAETLLMNGKRSPSLGAQRRLQEVLGVDGFDLLFITAAPGRRPQAPRDGRA